MPDEPRLRRSALFAGVAEGVVATALPLLAANLTHDPWLVAGVIAAQQLPWLLVAFGWHLLSPGDRRTAVGLIDTLRAVAVGYLGFITVNGTDTIRAIYVIAFIIGFGEALTGTVEEESDDTSRLSTRGMVGIALVGMPLGGLLYEVFGAVPFVIDVLFFALAALFALFVPRPLHSSPASTAVGRPQFAVGTTWVTATAFVASVARSTILGILVLFALENLGLGAPAFGLLLGGLAVATAAGGFVAPEAGAALGLHTGFAVASIIAAISLVTAAGVADASRPWAAAVALGIAWATSTTGSVLLRALLPVSAGRPVVGNQLRAFHLVEWTGACVGALAGGWFAHRYGVKWVVQWSAVPWLLAAISVAAVRRAAAVTPLPLVTDKWLDAA